MKQAQVSPRINKHMPDSPENPKKNSTAWAAQFLEITSFNKSNNQNQ